MRPIGLLIALGLCLGACSQASSPSGADGEPIQPSGSFPRPTSTIAIDSLGTLVMVSDRDGDTGLFLLGGGRLQAQRLSAASEPGAGIVDLAPAWSPDARRIAHHRLTPDGRDALVVIEVETGEIEATADIGPPPIITTQPSWSPDGTRVAYWSTGDASNEIRVLDFPAGSTTNLTNDPAADRFPAWSPDGARIAFWTDRSGKGELWIMKSDGSDPMPVAAVGNSFGPAAWSPDGASLAVAVQRGPNAFVVVITDAAGRIQAELPTEVSTVSPAWSPDGRRLAFWDLLGPIRQLIVTDTSGGKLTRLGPVASAPNGVRLVSHVATPWPAAPAWSPDGDQLAVEWARADGILGLLIVAVESNDWRFLTDSATTESSPAWRPGQP
jgi:Tol biopolymer transport system component